MRYTPSGYIMSSLTKLKLYEGRMWESGARGRITQTLVKK